MKDLINFVERHKKFFKRIAIFAVCYIAISFSNNSAVNTLLTQFFGEYITTAFHAAVPTILLVSEV